jgi:hypothetical protein
MKIELVAMKDVKMWYEKKTMKKTLKKLHAPRQFWKPHNITLCWSFFSVNDK